MNRKPGNKLLLGLSHCSGGCHEQNGLGKNRIALDMMLAEKGGVCVMHGNCCCTFFPNNTAPNVTINRALQGLTTLANELAENSGADTSITGWLES
ncbi:Provirus ancestral Env polyprotein [Aix galericulata]|nr:Provirus ancestral Env polyprotein [Aix galericulata]